EANLGGVDLSGADLTRADLAGVSLVHANMTKATLNGCLIYGISAWDVLLDGASQLDLVITDPYSREPTIAVDDLEVAQFVYLLLNHQKLRSVLNAVTARGVLLLGRFGDGG